jgi:PIN domain nuclease of toxin-antitoxin system
MRILLDTCTFLWIAIDSHYLSPLARKLFAAPENEIYLSAISAWEIGVKYSAGKLTLPESPGTYIPSRRATYEIAELPLDEESALQQVRLPRLHADPFDRALICQSIIHGLALLTPDEQIARYSARVLW